MAQAEKPNYHTHALTRGLQLLETVAASATPSTLGDLHDASGLPKSTIVRLLSTLTGAGYLVRIDDRPAYVLGASVLRIATPYLDSLDIADLVDSRLRQLAETTRQTVNLGILDGTEVLHLAVVTPSRPLYFDAAPGGRAPVYCTGLGKALLAALPPEEVAEHLPPTPWVGGHGGTHAAGPDELAVELDRTRERGYSLDDNEFAEGLTCVAVRLATITPVALSVSGASGEFSGEKCELFARLVTECAATLAADPAVVAALDAAPRRR
ncbi:MAG TPA: IclR family transcriptional regulator [Propionibacteriaceae bacterium]|nr:IclR family transcriptional regulator [Propionibacteriaceae bacterium]HPZ49089.1 IclR family transcriptional regulator [Propionibacteriaceae bacterium]HQE30688.1 IclR family transcriptional regulator [Propionibacteriaceae bacterium]